MICIRIPANLRSEADDQSTVDVEANTAGEALRQLTERYPGLTEHLCDQSGELHAFVQVFINEQSIRELSGMETPVQANDEMLIVPALAGG